MRQKRFHLKRGILVAAITAALLLMSNLAVNAQNFSDAEIKAVYIYKMGKFLLWNGQKRSPIDFCYMESGRSPEEASVGRSMEKLVDAKHLQSEWRVTRVRTVEGTDDCDILFLASTEESAVSNVLSRAGNSDILTISDIKRFIYKDGMVGFVLDDQNRVKMEANLKNIRKTRVQVSAQVLEFMVKVVK